MNRFLIIGIHLLAAAFSVLSAGAQSSIRGAVRGVDSSALAGASVVVIHSGDSIINGFTRTGAEGRFQLQRVSPGNYLLIISLSGYADLTMDMTVPPSEPLVDLGSLVLSSRTAVLEEVIIRKKTSSIKMRGDTVEYLADSFGVRANANVEELLKRLPGISVDRNGNVTVYGEQVRHILVDGEEFFGHDPTLVTRSLRADVVDKVQVFEKEGNTLTAGAGSMGLKEKTINLKLKENKKNGYFGKVYHGIGSSGFYESQAMYNYFKGPMKLAAYGIISNTALVGLGWQERDKYGIKENLSQFMADDFNTWSGEYEGKGIPSIKTGGLHYNNTWNGKHALNLNYKYSNLSVKGFNHSFSEATLPGATNLITDKQNFNNQQQKHQVGMNYKISLDSLTSLHTVLEGQWTKKDTDHDFDVRIESGARHFLSSNKRNVLNQHKEGLLYWKTGLERKMKKHGRGILVELQGAHDRSRSGGYVNSTSRLVSANGLADSIQLDDFNRRSQLVFQQLGVQVKYVEPVAKNWRLSLLYEMFSNLSRSTVLRYNKDAGGNYSERDSSLSNEYEFKRFTKQAGAFLNYNSRKILYSMGGWMSSQQFDQANVYGGSKLQRHFINLNAKADFVYQFNVQKKINFYYTGNAVPPRLFQVQPVVSNVDPLNVYRGNPDLKPAYVHTLGLGYNSYQAADQKYVFSNVNISFEPNHITSDIRVDSSGKSIYQFVNQSGYRKFWSYLGLGRSFGTQTNIGLNLSFTGERHVPIVNGKLNQLSSNSYEIEAFGNRMKDKRYALGLRIKSSYVANRSLLSDLSGLNASYWVHEISSSAEVFIKHHFRIHSEATYYARPNFSVFAQDLNAFIWNVWVGRSFFRETLLVKFSCHDLLNQNTGFANYRYNHIITQSNFSTINRYFMISLNWDFNKTLNGGTSQ